MCAGPVILMELLESRQFLAGNGLAATYFDNRNFSGRTTSRIDSAVNFDFGNHQSPAPGIAGDTFAVRWSGMIYPAFTETYTFTVRSNDGVRLWINGQPVIDAWAHRPRGNVSGTISLQARRLYDLRLEYFDDKRTAAIALKWNSVSLAEQFVPSNRLYAYDTRVATVGDFGIGNSLENDTARMVNGWGPDVVITTGDNNYPSGAAETIDQNIGQFYHGFIGDYQGSYGRGARTNRFFPTLGNHDWELGNINPYLDYFTLPGNERYYDFVQGSIHFFVLDSDTHEPDGTSPNSVQGNWLRNALADSTSLYNVVYFHHPPFSSGLKHGSTARMQWPFKDWGVDAVLSGHDHIYERLSVDGLPYFVVGASAETRAVGVGIAGSIVRNNSDVGALLIQASEKRITFQYQLRNDAIVDTYTISPRAH